MYFHDLERRIQFNVLFVFPESQKVLTLEISKVRKTGEKITVRYSKNCLIISAILL